MFINKFYTDMLPVILNHGQSYFILPNIIQIRSIISNIIFRLYIIIIDTIVRLNNSSNKNWNKSIW